MNYQPPMSPLEIIHQDADLVVLNKPSGLLSVPGRQAIHKDSLQTRVQAIFPTATTVHRLDMETSGLIVMALNKASHVSLSRQFEQRLVTKQYLARVYGQVHESEGQVDAPLICDWPNRPKQKVDFEKGKNALTHWQVLQTEVRTTLLSLKPITGRSHQLRVHMMYLGYPIVGDQLYATSDALLFSDRLQLHSQMLAFSHPVTDASIQFHSEADF